ncbi:MAG: SDR family NAD(P)-dependent oxidoreductase [Bacillota bacterium]
MQTDGLREERLPPKEALMGLAAAWRMADGGANLVPVARSRNKAEEVRARLKAAYLVDVDIVIADFCRLGNARRAAGEIREKHPVIDVLINSAGLRCTRRRLTKDCSELVF